MSFSRACELISKMEKRTNEEAKILIEDENLCNEIDTSGNRLLHYASKVGNHEIVQFLVDSRKAIINVHNNLTQTPLISNLKSGSPCKKTIEVLLKAGASASIPENGDQSALDIVDSDSWLNEDKERYEIYKNFLENARNSFFDFTLLKDGTEKEIKLLLQTDIDVSLTDSEGTTLVYALASNRNSGIAAILRGKNFDVNARNENGWTPLMIAALVGSCSVVKFLLDEGADIDAADNLNRTALCLTFVRFNLDKENYKCIQVLLERGANVQLEITSVPNYTVFDLVLLQQQLGAGELLILAHLALQEEKGTTITRLIRSKIESNNRFKTYFEHCRQQLSMEIYRSITVFNVLTFSEIKLEHYLRDKNFALKLEIFETVDYYETVLRKRRSTAITIMELRSKAGSIIGGLIQIDYDSYPYLVDEIATYLDKKDVECLLSIRSELSH